LTGVAGDQQTDLQRPASFYRPPNGLALLAPRPMADRVAGEATSITVGGKHAFAGSWIGHAKLGYFKSKNDPTGGRRTCHGPLADIAFEPGLAERRPPRAGPRRPLLEDLLTGAVFARWAAIYRWVFPERSGLPDFSGA
jgi:hypothetical protein